MYLFGNLLDIPGTRKYSKISSQTSPKCRYAPSFVQASTVTLWCRLRAPGGNRIGQPLFDAGFCLEGPKRKQQQHKRDDHDFIFQFRKIFEVFVSFERLSDVFGSIRIRSDPLGCIWTHSEAIGSVCSNFARFRKILRFVACMFIPFLYLFRKSDLQHEEKYFCTSDRRGAARKKY